MPRPLTPAEYRKLIRVARRQRRSTAARDLALVICLRRTGYRVGELLSLTIGDLLPAPATIRARSIRPEDLRPRITVAARFMKGGRKPRSVPLHREARHALAAWLDALHRRGTLLARAPLWPSQQSRHGTGQLALGFAESPVDPLAKSAMTRQRAWQIIRRLARLAGIKEADMDGLGLHSFRKLFVADMMVVSGGNLRKAQLAVGHARSTTTELYLPPDQAEIDAMIVAVT